jgi:hypothetical protein
MGTVIGLTHEVWGHDLSLDRLEDALAAACPSPVLMAIGKVRARAFYTARFSSRCLPLAIKI